MQRYPDWRRDACDVSHSQEAIALRKVIQQDRRIAVAGKLRGRRSIGGCVSRRIRYTNRIELTNPVRRSKVGTAYRQTAAITQGKYFARLLNDSAGRGDAGSKRCRTAGNPFKYPQH